MNLKNRGRLALVLVFALLAGSLLTGGNMVIAQKSAEADTREYSGSDPSSEQLSNPRNIDGVTTWDCVYFGNYWQNDTNGDGIADENDEKEPIKWRVLSVDGDDAFLMADEILDCQELKVSGGDIGWKYSYMRNWLNHEFFNDAFSATEQKAISKVAVKNEEGNNTVDKIYLLSMDEAMNPSYGFTSKYTGSETRMAEHTAYYGEKSGKTSPGWCLRSLNQEANGYSLVRSDGYVCRHSVYWQETAVRPVLHLKLSLRQEWMPAGTTYVDGRFSEVAESPKALSAPQTSRGVTTWDCIYFGNYWINDTDGGYIANQDDEKEPIKWRVLSVDGDDVFLLSDQCIDRQPYHDKEEAVAWETCTLRSWLNNEFLKEAFTSDEQAAIMDTTVVNPDSSDTKDKIYILSSDELTTWEYGFESAVDPIRVRVGKNTPYAGGHIYKYNYWCLRSPREEEFSVSYIDEDGIIRDTGWSSNANIFAIRPVLHLNLSQCRTWKAAGWVTSKGYVVEFLPVSTAESTPTAEPPQVESPSQEIISNPRNTDGITTWDCVYFGSYWQNDTNGDGTADQKDGKEPIKWRVLSVNDSDMLLLADQGIESRIYSRKRENYWTWNRWDTCEMREWLNNEFLENAFTKSEQTVIPKKKVINEKNHIYGTEGGNDTNDKIYLLSADEAINPEYGFDSWFGEDDTRTLKCTEYAKNENDVPIWWLRSPGDKYNASYVDGNGYINKSGADIGSTYCAVRPALYVKVTLGQKWAFAGTVSSDGAVNEIPYVKTEGDLLPSEAPDIAPVESQIPSEAPMPSQSEEPDESPDIKPVESQAPGEQPMPSKAPEIGTGGLPTPGLSETSAGQAQPVQTASVTPSPEPTAQTDITVQWKITGFHIRANTRREAVLTWKKIKGVSFYKIYRSFGSNGSYRLIKTISAGQTTFVDQPPKVWKKYYYKVSAVGKIDGTIYEGKKSETKAFQGRELRTPTVFVRKGAVGKITYITVSLKKYEGKYADIYISTGKGKYRRLKLVSNKIKTYKGKFKIQYIVRKTTIRLKVRTYRKKKKKKVYSDFSREYTIRA